jgi:hypothetical protein
MYPLIEITTVPIEIEIKTTRARLTPVVETPEPERLETAPEVRRTPRPQRDHAPDGFQSSKEAPFYRTPYRFQPTWQDSAGAAAAAPSGIASLYDEDGLSPVSAAAAPSGAGNLPGGQLLPPSAPSAPAQPQAPVAAQLSNASLYSDYAVNPADMQALYEMDKVQTDYRTDIFDYEPGGLEISITQQPDIVVKYVGGPQYVPPSANPDYEEPAEG